jgi:hypothetical protein
MNQILQDPEKTPIRIHALVFGLSIFCAIGIPWFTHTMGWAMAHSIVHHHYIDGTSGYTGEGFEFFGYDLPYVFKYLWPGSIFLLVFILSRLVLVHKVFRRSA